MDVCQFATTVQVYTHEDLSALLPEAVIEEVGDRRELVIYTGYSIAPDGSTLVPMDD